MTLDDAKIQRFLATKEVAVLATVQPDGAPPRHGHVVSHDPAALTMISVDGLQKVRNLRRDPRVSVVAEAGGGELRHTRRHRERARAIPRRRRRRRALVEGFHAKYPRLSALWGGRVMPANRVMFKIVPERIKSWGLT